VTKTQNDRASRPAPDRPRELGGYRRAALGALAAEVGHELQGPVNLFRLTRERLGHGAVLDEDDLSALDEELARMSRLSARLRALSKSSFSPSLLAPRELVEAALGSAPPPLDGAELALELDAASELRVTGDRELLARALRELIDNALEARSQRAGVRFEPGPPTGFCVWDDGPGLELDAEQAMSWGTTTRPAAPGIGLTIALRAARAHGFGLELRRSAPFTEAWLWIPPRALRAPGREEQP